MANPQQQYAPPSLEKYGPSRRYYPELRTVGSYARWSWNHFRTGTRLPILIGMGVYLGMLAAIPITRE